MIRSELNTRMVMASNMDERITSIRVEFNKDYLSSNWESYDIDASMDRYAEHLVNHIYADYPDAEIEVVQTNGINRILVNGMLGHPAAEDIQSISIKIWYGADWEVELD